MTMNIRKIAVVGGFAVGAAVTFAPLASADDLTTTVSSEIASANDAFQTDTFLTGNYADVVYHTGGLDTILATRSRPAPQLSPVPTTCLMARWSSSTTPTTLRRTRS